MKKICHQATGGTIDSHWDPAADTAIINEESCVEKYLRDSARVPVNSSTIVLKDSRHITMRDREAIAATVAESLEQKIFLTAGTYLMPDIAREIADHPMAKYFKDQPKTVALTGALTPLTGFAESDGGFNLGMCIAVLTQEFHGRIFLVMNGSCFDAVSVRKNPSEAQFNASAGADVFSCASFDLITAGGTMDFEFNSLDGLVPSPRSRVPGFLRNTVRLNRKFGALSPFNKDSRDMREPDMDLICRMVRNSTQEHVLITMGIYRLAQMREYLKTCIGDEAGGKRVVLTGSRLPLGFGFDSDAPFQIGYALGSIGFQSPGIHIAVNGKVLHSGDDPILSVFRPEEVLDLVKSGVLQQAA